MSDLVDAQMELSTAGREDLATMLHDAIERKDAAIAEAADKALLYATKYADIVQAISDPENQPSQYGTVTIDCHYAAIAELVRVLKASRESLGRANVWGGSIRDTIWHTKHETLFDFMDSAIAKYDIPKAAA